MQTLYFLRRHPRILGFGVFLFFIAGFGQTYFISVFGGELRARFGLSDGELGTLYGAATLFSALCILPAGGILDRFRLLPLSLGICGGLAVGCVVMATAWHGAVLGLGFFVIRFFGQGLMAQLSVVAMARRFEAERGRALAVASLGMQVGMAVFPAFGLALIGLFGWRGAWWASAGLLTLVCAPTLVALLGSSRRRQGSAAADPPAVGDGWTRREVLHDRHFYAVVPLLVALPFIHTAIIFHHTRLVVEKGWTLAGFAVGFSASALLAVLAAFGAGFLVDRYGARRVFPLVCLPMTAGLLFLWAGTHLVSGWLFLVLIGISGGLVSVSVGALWAETYGLAHIGSIKSVSDATMILSSAAGPVAVGGLIDAGWPIADQAAIMAAYGAVAGVVAWVGGPVAPSDN